MACIPCKAQPGLYRCQRTGQSDIRLRWLAGSGAKYQLGHIQTTTKLLKFHEAVALVHLLAYSNQLGQVQCIASSTRRNISMIIATQAAESII